MIRDRPLPYTFSNIFSVSNGFNQCGRAPNRVTSCEYIFDLSLMRGRIDFQFLFREEVHIHTLPDG